MKAKLLFKELLDKSEIENKNEFYSELDNIPDVDLPDRWQAVHTGMSKLVHEKVAPKKKEIQDQVISKYNENLNRSYVAKLQGQGFSDVEIDAIMQQPFESRTEKALEFALGKERQKFSLSESERIKQEEQKAKAAQERADRMQAQMLEREKNFEKELTQKEVDFQIRNEMQRIPLRNGNDALPHDKASKLILEEVKQRMKALGAKAILSDGRLRLVDDDNDIQDYYDDRNNPITFQQLLEKTAADLNLLERRNASFGANSPRKETRTINMDSGQLTSNQQYIKGLISSITPRP